MKLTSRTATVLSKSSSSSISASSLLSTKFKLGYNNKSKSRRFPLYTLQNNSTMILITVLLSLILIDNSKIYANAKNLYSPCGAFLKDQSIIEPFFEIYKSNGIRISLPMLDFGMKGFEFHANINELISLDEPGTINGKAKFSKYSNQWSLYLEEPNINVGDRLNYWYEIKINNTAKRYQKLTPFVVQYEIPVPPNFNHFYELPETTSTTSTTPIPFESTTKQSCSIQCNTNEIKKLQNEISYLRNELHKVQQDFFPIIEEINTLKRLVAIDNENTENDSRELLLTSKKNFPYNNAIDDVRFIISEKLKLHDMETKIVQAKYTRCGILFEMESAFDKQFLLSKAQNTLSKNYHIQIIEPIDNCIPSTTQNDDDISTFSRIDIE